MKFVIRLQRWGSLLWPRLLAHGFRLTGWKVFISLFKSGRDILLSEEEIFLVADSIRRQPSPLLIFGAGNDSILWQILNRHRLTVFLEADPYWIKQIGSRFKWLDICHVAYSPRLDDPPGADGLHDRPPDLPLPPRLREQAWSIVLVDAPQGWGDGPGRRQSIFEAARLAAPSGRIFVHDCDRPAEQALVRCYLSHLHCRRLTPRLWCFDHSG